jgi:4-carboxymuconolactone decarboxylase
VVIDVGATTDLDVTTAEMVLQLATDLSDRGIALALAQARGKVRDRMERTGLLSVIGKERVHLSMSEAVAAERARLETDEAAGSDDGPDPSVPAAPDDGPAVPPGASWHVVAARARQVTHEGGFHRQGHPGCWARKPSGVARPPATSGIAHLGRCGLPAAGLYSEVNGSRSRPGVSMKTIVMSTAEEGFRRFTIGDPSLIAAMARGEGSPLEVPPLDALTDSLLRISALIALDAPASSYREVVDATLSAWARLDELLAVLISVAPTVGSARVVSAAPKIALAAGYDVEASLEMIDPAGMRPELSSLPSL